MLYLIDYLGDDQGAKFSLGYLFLKSQAGPPKLFFAHHPWPNVLLSTSVWSNYFSHLLKLIPSPSEKLILTNILGSIQYLANRNQNKSGARWASHPHQRRNDWSPGTLNPHIGQLAFWPHIQLQLLVQFFCSLFDCTTCLALHVLLISATPLYSAVWTSTSLPSLIHLPYPQLWLEDAGCNVTQYFNMIHSCNFCYLLNSDSADIHQNKRSFEWAAQCREICECL